jgi:hypothetical protein
MEYVFVMYRVLLSWYVHDWAFVRMELHKPVIFPFCCWSRSSCSLCASLSSIIVL